VRGPTDFPCLESHGYDPSAPFSFLSRVELLAASGKLAAVPSGSNARREIDR